MEYNVGVYKIRTCCWIGCLALVGDCSYSIPPSCSSKPLRSPIFFRHFHPVPRGQVRLEALHHLPKNALTYTRQHAPRGVLTRSMSPKQKMASPMRGAATWRSSTSRCRSLSGRSIEPLSLVITCFWAACLDPQCRSIKCTRCKKTVTMTGLTLCDASCLFRYVYGQEIDGRSAEIYLRIDLGQTIEYASIRKTIHHGYTLTKWTRANWMGFEITGQVTLIWPNLTILKSIWSGLPVGGRSKW